MNVRLVAIHGASGELIDLVVMDAPNIEAVQKRVNDEGGIVLKAEEATAEEVEEAMREE